MKKRAFSTVIKSKTKSTTTVIASTPTPDRYDDIVAGGDEWIIGDETGGYMANPVVQFGHDYTKPPVGKTTKLTTDKDGNLIATIKWDDSPTNPLGQTVAAQFRDGFMSAVSVGFQPTHSIPRNKLPKDHPHYGEKGMQFTGNNLLEISAVPVPANGEALALRSMGVDKAKSILSVEETDDTWVVTYAKYPPAEDEDEEGDEDEVEEEAFGDDEMDEDEDEAYGDEDEDDKAVGDEEGDEDEDEDEDKALGSGARAVLKTMVRDTILELLGTDAVVRSILTPEQPKLPAVRSADSMSVIFGLDK